MSHLHHGKPLGYKGSHNSCVILIPSVGLLDIHENYIFLIVHVCQIVKKQNKANI